MAVLPRSGYYDIHYRQTAALLRARQPYLIKNIIGGVTICAMTISIYLYTIHAVAQDDFSDVPMPDLPPKGATMTPVTNEVVKASANAFKTTEGVKGK